MRLHILKKYITVGALCLMTLAGCRDFLEEETKGLLSEEQIPQNLEGAQALAFAPYQIWVEGATLYGRWLHLWELGTDDMSATSSRKPDGMIADHVRRQVNPNDARIYGDIWVPLWKGIEDCNKAIELIQKIEPVEIDTTGIEPHQINQYKQIEATLITEERKKALIGEVRTMRALNYYYLVRMWGDVPFVTKSQNKFSEMEMQPRVDVDSIYSTLIEEDLKYAISVLPETYPDNFRGRMTKSSANVILADVYLTRASWRKTAAGPLVKGDPVYYDSAMKYSLDVIENTAGFRLEEQEMIIDGDTVPAYGIPWVMPFSNESLVEFGSKAGILGEAIPLTEYASSNHKTDAFWRGKAQGQNMRGGSGWYMPTPDLFLSFEPGDLRRKWGMLTKSKMYDGGMGYSAPMFHKMVSPNRYKRRQTESGYTSNDDDLHFVMYRVADAMLIYAEAANEVYGGPTGMAYEQINRLRSRAGLPDLYPNKSQNEFRASVWEERRAELHGECKRKFDLVRTNRLKQKAGNRENFYYTNSNPDLEAELGTSVYSTTQDPVVYPEHEYLWPISLNELSIHPHWTQNSGY
ncbi:RagB/SusD family nutrient uptake outer membrane protein [Flammeovirga aprica]|uniref:RagB/SusD family nutrient uptake outer membrane protein n=1 Tax=Flammeovirga aprica JL-4 TaxID=694437 RepID=A0A7X9XB02_9BACT|nr:RagB/SusD family nutrient uptake outer membrane protein [Flammeovirga aprica]NME70138.1 RagB/SusD family nutrient uptake outer membrane protein [Flammeovirga aprica JL-4]